MAELQEGWGDRLDEMEEAHRATLVRLEKLEGQLAEIVESDRLQTKRLNLQAKFLGAVVGAVLLGLGVNEAATSHAQNAIVGLLFAGGVGAVGAGYVEQKS